MYDVLLALHNWLRWIILILLVVAIFRHLAGMNARREFSDADKRIDLFLMIAAHITLLIGLYQWAAGPWGLQNITGLGFGEVMKSKLYRFWAVEHITGMIIGIALITVARGSFRKVMAPEKKHKRALTLLVIALVVLLVTIPWPFREEIARPLLRGI